MSAEIRSFRDLVVWHKAMDLVGLIYHFARKFPADERCGLTSQLKRAAVSASGNLAEGCGRHSTSDYIRFLKISLGSSCEVDTPLELARRLKFVPGDEMQEALELCAEI